MVPASCILFWMRNRIALLLSVSFFACATGPTPTATSPTSSSDPLLAIGAVLATTDPEYGRGDLPNAVKPPGQGGLLSGAVIRLHADTPVYRLWSGPAKKDARGNTNRIGQWWSFDRPKGSRQGYREAYEICLSWNDLTYVAQCTLRKGAVVSVGPGNSVSAQTCNDASGKEVYPENRRDFQIFISKAWTRVGENKELSCPEESADYEADDGDISKPRSTAN